MVLQLLLMSAILGGSCFGIGMLPLSYTFSRTHLEYLSVIGTGLLLGAALGVIIPEGVESMWKSGEANANKVALCLVAGFVVMVIIEQLVAPSAHSHSIDVPLPLHQTINSQVEFVSEIEDLDSESSRLTISSSAEDMNGSQIPSNEKAFALLLGLVIHAAADGLALGVANLVRNEDGHPNPVSFVVFLALMLHKAPTSLAFTTSLLSLNLPRFNCKKYVAIFSASTPLSAITSYLLFGILGSNSPHDVTSISLLVSGGSFLYVATVLQPVSHNSIDGLRPLSRVCLLVIGMFTPIGISSIIGHGH